MSRLETKGSRAVRAVVTLLVAAIIGGLLAGSAGAHARRSFDHYSFKVGNVTTVLTLNPMTEHKDGSNFYVTKMSACARNVLQEVGCFRPDINMSAKQYHERWNGRSWVHCTNTSWKSQKGNESVKLRVEVVPVESCGGAGFYRNVSDFRWDQKGQRVGVKVASPRHWVS